MVRRGRDLAKKKKKTTFFDLHMCTFIIITTLRYIGLGFPKRVSIFYENDIIYELFIAFLHTRILYSLRGFDTVCSVFYQNESIL